MKNQDVIDKLLAYHPPMPGYEGCDGYKCGDPQAECTGVATALVPTVEVIRKAAALGCNLLVTHEPIYYMTPDFPEWRGPFPNRIYEEKRTLLRETGMTVYRDHDHIHSDVPDGIFTGVLKYLGWEPYYTPRPDCPLLYPCTLPPQPLRAVRQHLIDTLHLNGLRYMGDLDRTVSRVALCAHLYPGAFQPRDPVGPGQYMDYATLLIREMERENGIEVLIPGEIIEWDVLAYIRDAVALGHNKACLNIGHFNLEELGSRYQADWLSGLIGRPVHYIPTGDSFRYA